MDWASNPERKIPRDLYGDLYDLSSELGFGCSSLMSASKHESLRRLAEGRMFNVDTRVFTPVDQSFIQLQEYQPVKLIPEFGRLTLDEIEETKSVVSEDLESAVSFYHFYSRVCPPEMKPQKFIDVWKRVRDHFMRQEELATDPLMKFVFSNDKKLFVNGTSELMGSQLFDYLRCLAPNVKPTIYYNAFEIIDVVRRMSQVAPYISDEDLLSLKWALGEFNDRKWLQGQDKQLLEHLAGNIPVDRFVDSFKYNLRR